MMDFCSLMMKEVSLEETQERQKEVELESDNNNWEARMMTKVMEHKKMNKENNNNLDKIYKMRTMMMIATFDHLINIINNNIV